MMCTDAGDVFAWGKYRVARPLMRRLTDADPHATRRRAAAVVVDPDEHEHGAQQLDDAADAERVRDAEIRVELVVGVVGERIDIAGVAAA